MRNTVSRRRILGGLVAGLSVGGAACLRIGDGGDDSLPVSNAHQYSAPGCSCCTRYATSIQRRLETTLEETRPADVESVKRRFGIPPPLRSCHTLVLDGYAVEGHVPVAAIATLVADAPDIVGIALPGMPPGSPGMGGEKQGPFTIYAIGGGRTGEVYVEI